MRDDPSELLDLAEWYRELAHVGRDHHRRDRTHKWQSTWKAGPRSWISESSAGG